MKILRYWKTVPLVGGFTYQLVPVREVSQDGDAFFNHIVEAVRRSGLDYVLVEQPSEILLEEHSEPLP